MQNITLSSCFHLSPAIAAVVPEYISLSFTPLVHSSLALAAVVPDMILLSTALFSSPPAGANPGVPTHVLTLSSASPIHSSHAGADPVVVA